MAENIYANNVSSPLDTADEDLYITCQVQARCSTDENPPKCEETALSHEPPSSNATVIEEERLFKPTHSTQKRLIVLFVLLLASMLCSVLSMILFVQVRAELSLLRNQFEKVNLQCGMIGKPEPPKNKGVKGDIGPPGFNGRNGEHGSPGDTSDLDDEGSSGITCSDGSKGEAGPPGLKGEIGYTGFNGTNGAPGRPGDTGDKGAEGSPGIPGSKGSKGEAGPSGLKGEIGYTGASGLKGTKGVKGQIGATGNRGAKGQKGGMATTISYGVLRSTRLVGGDYKSGRVEIKHDGVWGTICDDGWGTDDGAVVCRMLRFDGVRRVFANSAHGQGSGKIWLDDLDCSGSESSVDSCGGNSWGDNNCDHREDASVECY